MRQTHEYATFIEENHNRNWKRKKLSERFIQKETIRFAKLYQEIILTHS